MFDYFSSAVPNSTTASTSSNTPADISEAASTEHPNVKHSITSTETEVSESETSTAEDLNDIGIVFANDTRNIHLVNKLDNNSKYRLLTAHWTPDKSFEYPYTLKDGKRPQKVYLSEKHLCGSYENFKFSKKLNGVICVPCVIFSDAESQNDRKKATQLGQLVNKPLQKYSRLTGSDGHLTSHLSKQYHQKAQHFADNFIHSYRTNQSIKTALDTQRKNSEKEEREKLIPIIKTVVLCARLGIAFRGRHDDGVLNVNTPFQKEEGNFRALLAFRVDSGDKCLEKHLQAANKNATYISKTIQNEIIELCGEQVRNHIISLAKHNFYSIIVDETTDASHREQICICLRFVDKDARNNHIIREEFLTFGSAKDLSGAGLARQILDFLNSSGLDLKNLCGQGYDGARSMSGHIKGVQSRIQALAPDATYVHCSSHTLNLVLNDSCAVPEIRNMFQDVREITKFINDSCVRREMFSQTNSESGDTRSLKILCDTRFIERHDALITFSNQLERIFECLEQIAASNSSRETTDRARSFMKKLLDSEFLISLACAKKVMSLTINVSRSLQTINKDLLDAIKAIEYILSTLEDWRTANATEKWLVEDEPCPWICGSEMAKRLGVGIEMPRMTQRQCNRSNVPASNASKYFKRAIWYPYLDTIITSLKLRFGDHQTKAYMIIALIPSEIENFQWSDIKPVFQRYADLLGDVDVDELRHEFNQWRIFCINLPTDERAKTALATLDIIPSR